VSGRAIVVVGGQGPALGVIDDAGAFVIAADSGLDRALEMGLRVDLVVGDLDSVTDEALASARAAGVPVEVHPVDKDATDLELALGVCVARGATQVQVVALDGGRPDHWLANVSLLCSPRWADMDMRALSARSEMKVVRADTELDHPAGSLVTLLAWGGPVHGVETSGLRWTPPSTLVPGDTIGVSNEITAPPARITVADGVLLVVIPVGDRA
jgi:thiamine pyrophosphokinase